MCVCLFPPRGDVLFVCLFVLSCFVVFVSFFLSGDAIGDAFGAIIEMQDA